MSSGAESEFSGLSNGRSKLKIAQAVPSSSNESSFEATSPLSSVPMEEGEGVRPRIPEEDRPLSLRSGYEWINYKVRCARSSQFSEPTRA